MKKQVSNHKERNRTWS